MEITKIKIYRVNGQQLKAYVTVIFDDAFIVRDLKIISSNNRLFVAMPNRKLKDGTYKDIAHPINQEMRDQLEKKIINKYISTFNEE